ncbi:MAG: hypothetical protein BWY90_01365 [Deltaproteobacteria bacterium ADurb.BinA014]|nr:MAG: hypothetical protein BWY90_01365 [Deltaproteobacteria bacterium ADurb.BinA014]
MVFIQHLARFFDIQVIRRGFVPRQGGNPIQISRGNSVFRRGRIHPREPLQFAQRFFLCFLGKIFLFDFFAVFFRFDRVFIRLAQFLLNGLELLTQVVFALAFIDIILDFGLDFIAQFENFLLVIDHARQFLQARFDINAVKYFLFFFNGRIDNRGNQIRQRAGFGNGFGHWPEFRRQKGRKFENPVKQNQQIGNQRLAFDILYFCVLNNLNPRLLVGLAFHQL